VNAKRRASEFSMTFTNCSARTRVRKFAWQRPKGENFGRDSASRHSRPRRPFVAPRPAKASPS